VIDAHDTGRSIRGIPLEQADAAVAVCNLARRRYRQRPLWHCPLQQRPSVNGDENEHASIAEPAGRQHSPPMHNPPWQQSLESWHVSSLPPRR